MRDNGKEDVVGCEITRKRTLGKGGGADKQGGAHSRYQFFRCGKIGGGGGGADKRWGALWRYSTVLSSNENILVSQSVLLTHYVHMHQDSEVEGIDQP